MEASWWKNIADLDDDQKKAISLDEDEDHLIVGPPGCGKTNLLLLRASYLHAKGVTNIKVLAFGRVLREFISAGTEHYPFAADKVQTFFRWSYEVLAANGIQIEESDNFDEVRARLFEGLKQIAEKGAAENVFDVVLLDEAQDYSAEEAEIISLFGARIFAVGDNNQRISEKTGALQRLEELGATRTDLKHHYRNGIKICRVADGIKNLLDNGAGMEATSNYDEASFPSTVDVFSGVDIEDQVAEAISRIKLQLQAYPGEMIGVLCPRAAELDRAAELLGESEIQRDIQVQRSGAYDAIDPDRPVIVTTVQGAKGLEFRSVHMLAAEMLKRYPTQKNLTYTAVTRAKTSLVVYHNGGLAGYFEKGLNACSISKAVEPNLKDLFL
ncbi:ATP-binding domain-containing protein [Ponticoccus alexandrii]|uniref:DNA 3'-5' helicase II n=1 Tax=Ponticoccus alexandrii TaxID=1943633 RepID=A0ABX7FB64_9RHOB|nr:ATP-binding domain-containing protein [Ponticoccus alexandrii]ETA51207.1 RNA helicase [Rhodobacteraceae bacterium PD-2]QRF67790.1 ATP-binding domain-containing protein [Ponticoccus alexandrii]